MSLFLFLYRSVNCSCFFHLSFQLWQPTRTWPSLTCSGASDHVTLLWEMSAIICDFKSNNTASENCHSGGKRLNVRNWSNFCLHFHPPLLLPFDLQPDHMSHQLLGDHEETHPALLLWVSSLKPNKKINRLIFSADACLTLFLLSECRSVESSETVQQNVWV